MTPKPDSEASTDRVTFVSKYYKNYFFLLRICFISNNDFSCIAIQDHKKIFLNKYLRTEIRNMNRDQQNFENYLFKNLIKADVCT